MTTQGARRAVEVLENLLDSDKIEQFRLNAADFTSPPSAAASSGTRIEQMQTGLDNAAEVVNRSFPQRDQAGQFTNVISPVVIPRDPRTSGWVVIAGGLGVLGLVGLVTTSVVDAA